MPDKTPGLNVRSPRVRLTVFGIQGPELNRDTGRYEKNQPDDVGVDFDVHVCGDPSRDYDIDGSSYERDLFMATLEIAKVSQLQRIARALEKIAGLKNEDEEKLWSIGRPGGVQPSDVRPSDEPGDQ